MGSLAEGAKNAVETCMSIKSDEHVLVVTDEAQYKIGYSIMKAAKKVTPYVEMHVLTGQKRPVYEVPEEIAQAIERSDASYWVTTGNLPYELEDNFVNQVMKNPKRRHAHMSGVTEQVMREGMCVNYNDVEKFTDKVYDIVSMTKEIKIEGNPNNNERTNLRLEMNPNWKWIKSSGIIKKGEWDNLPSGETETTPYKVNGTVVTNLLGDYFDGKWGILNPPISFDIVESMFKPDTLKCSNPKLKRELTSYLKKYKNGDRLAEISLPTNIQLIPKSIIGNMLIDEKRRPHIGFGDPPDDRIRADWSSGSHIDFILENCNVSVDGKKIMEKGRYLFDD